MPQARDEAGNIWETDAQGNPVRLIRAANQQMPPDPTYQYEAPQAQANLGKTQAEIEAINARTAAQNRQTSLAEQKFAVEQGKLKLTPAQQKADEEFAKEYVAWRAGGKAGLENNLKLLDDAINVLESSDTITGPVYGRLPKFIQQAVDPRGPNVRADVERVIQQSLKEILGAQFAQKEAEQLFARSFDPTQQEKFNASRIRATLTELRKRGEAKESAARFYDKHGTIAGWTGAGQNEDSDPLKAASPGSDTQSRPIPPEMQQEYQAWLASRSGLIDPQEYSAFRQELDRKYGFGSDPAEYEDYIRRSNGNPSGKPIPPANEPLQGMDALRNSAVNSAPGAFAADALNMGGFGIPEALAGNQYAALREERPLATTLGQIAGSVTGTVALGRGVGMGLQSLTRAAPRLTQQAGRVSPWARDLATDAVYSGVYGGVTGQDPLASAAQGAAGSLLGQGVGKVGGAAVRGVTMSAPVQTLRDRGVRTTVGQTLGGLFKGAEDAATSIPIAGDLALARRTEGFNDFNRAAFNDPAFSRIGVNTHQIGEKGVKDVLDQTSDFYKQATAGVDVPLDMQYAIDANRARAMASKLPPEAVPAFNKALGNILDPIEQSGRMTGDQFHSSFKNLKDAKSRVPNSASGFDQYYKDGITAAQDALRQTIERGGGQDVIDNLALADKAWGRGKTLQDAVKRARNGSRTGELQTFAPSQLNDAAWASQSKYPGERHFADLADAGQEVLPSKIPDSGTGRRLAQMALGGGLLGGGAGAYGYATGEYDDAAKTAAVLTGLLALGGTRKAQDLGIASLVNRPEIMRKIGEGIERRKGLLGSASLPFFIVN